MRIVYANGPFAQHMSKTRIVVVHQTSLTNAESILYGKILPNHGYRGCAIYACKDAPTTDHKCNNHGTYLLIEFYLGRNGNDIDLDKDYRYDSTYITDRRGLEIAVRSSDRALNIRYLKGYRPRNIWIEMRPRMPLIFGTTRNKAREIINRQELPTENHPNIAGVGYYLWPDIPSANDNGNSGRETFLVADVFFTNPFENRNYFPDTSDLQKYDSFRGAYKDTCYFMVKCKHRITRIHYIDGQRP